VNASDYLMDGGVIVRILPLMIRAWDYADADAEVDEGRRPSTGMEARRLVDFRDHARRADYVLRCRVLPARAPKARVE
jgi:hypothetical protein